MIRLLTILLIPLLLTCYSPDLLDITHTPAATQGKLVSELIWHFPIDRILTTNSASKLCDPVPIPCLFSGQRGLYSLQLPNNSPFQICSDVLSSYHNSVGPPRNLFGVTLDTPRLIESWCGHFRETGDK